MRCQGTDSVNFSGSFVSMKKRPVLNVKPAAADKFALISEIWDKFVGNCLHCYRPGENITVNEQLLSSKTRYKHTQFMQNKPDKYGLKFWVAVDVETNVSAISSQILVDEVLIPMGSCLASTSFSTSWSHF